jgi:nitroreductase
MTTEKSDQVLGLIQERCSARIPFDPDQSIPKEDLQQILEAARWAPTAHNIQNFELIVIDDRDVLASIGNIRMGGGSTTFIRENLPWLSMSEEELKQRKVGLLGTMFPPSWLKAGAGEENEEVEANDEEMQEEREGRNRFQGSLIESTATLVIMLYDPSKRAPASEGDFLGIMSLGCILENLWLQANALGVSVHIVSSLAAGPAAEEIQSLLSIPDNWQVVITIRLGYTSTPFSYLRVRRDVEDFVHFNKY